MRLWKGCELAVSVESKIAGRMSVPAVLEQLAEESAELAQAALKYARILRGENPTPVTLREAHTNLIEEKGDVEVCMAVLKEKMPLEYMHTYLDKETKKERWLCRLEEKDGTNHR